MTGVFVRSRSPHLLILPASLRLAAATREPQRRVRHALGRLRAFLPLGLLSCRRGGAESLQGPRDARDRGREQKRDLRLHRGGTRRSGERARSGKRRELHLGRLARRLLLLFLPLRAAKISIWIGGLFSRFCDLDNRYGIPWPNSTPCCGKTGEKAEKGALRRGRSEAATTAARCSRTACAGCGETETGGNGMR